MFTGQYAPKNGVPTLDAPTPTAKGSVLPPCAALPNLGSVLRKNGYEVAFKGKWHLSFPLGFAGGPPDGEVWTEADIANLELVYGLPGWTPPDAGNNAFNTPAARTTLGGGTADNDARFISGPQPGETPGFGESVVEYLVRMGRTPQARPGSVLPLCLPRQSARYRLLPEGWNEAGYPQSAFSALPVPIAPNAGDPLTTKPRVQLAYKNALEAEGPLDSAA